MSVKQPTASGPVPAAVAPAGTNHDVGGGPTAPAPVTPSAAAAAEAARAGKGSAPPPPSIWTGGDSGGGSGGQGSEPPPEAAPITPQTPPRKVSPRDYSSSLPGPAFQQYMARIKTATSEPSTPVTATFPTAFGGKIVGPLSPDSGRADQATRIAPRIPSAHRAATATPAMIRVTAPPGQAGTHAVAPQGAGTTQTAASVGAKSPTGIRLQSGNRMLAARPVLGTGDRAHDIARSKAAGLRLSREAAAAETRSEESRRASSRLDEAAAGERAAAQAARERGLVGRSERGAVRAKYLEREARHLRMQADRDTTHAGELRARASKLEQAAEAMSEQLARLDPTGTVFAAGEARPRGAKTPGLLAPPYGLSPSEAGHA